MRRMIGLLTLLTLLLSGPGTSMPVDRLLWSDDFSGYASQAEFEAAYEPQVFGSGTSVQSTDWGLTHGPGGVPGVKDADVHSNDSGSFEKWPLNTPCRAFKVSGRWDHARINAILTGHVFLRLIYTDNDEFFGTIVQLSTIHSTGSLDIAITTQPGYGDEDFPPRKYFSIPGGFPTDTISDIEIEGHVSTITETSPGVFEPADDGDITVRVNGSVVASWSGPIWHRQNTAGTWNLVEVHTIGRFTNLNVWDQSSCTPEVPDTEPNLCPPCVTPDKGTVDDGGGDDGTPPWIQPLIGQQDVCAGGGLVPTQPDLVHSEQWWGL